MFKVFRRGLLRGIATLENEALHNIALERQNNLRLETITFLSCFQNSCRRPRGSNKALILAGFAFAGSGES